MTHTLYCTCGEEGPKLTLAKDQSYVLTWCCPRCRKWAEERHQFIPPGDGLALFGESPAPGDKPG